MTGGKPRTMAQLQAAWPGWRIWRNRDGEYLAWLVESRPPLLLRSRTVAGLREQIEAETGGSDAGE